MAGTGRPRPACPVATAPPPSPPQARSRHTWWPLEARDPFLHQQQRPLPPPPPAAEVAPSPPTAAVATATSLTGGCGAFPTDGESDEFLCDADGMGIEGAVPAVRDAEALRTGQIYFVLPAAAGHRGLRREEIAALAVRASAALSPLAASAAAPGLPSLPSPADAGLGPA